MFRIQNLSHKLQLHLLLIFTSLLLIVVPAINKTPSRQVSESSLLAASQFLLLVDSEDYVRSWQATSEILKKMLPESTWHEQITRIRSFVGPIVERILYDSSYTDTARDVPQGEYVILTFISRFELREQVFETLTLILGDDNQWRVVGYFLR